MQVFILYTKGLINTLAKKAKRTHPCPLFLYASSTSEASWDSGNKNIAVCSLYSIGSWSFLYSQQDKNKLNHQQEIKRKKKESVGVVVKKVMKTINSLFGPDSLFEAK